MPKTVETWQIWKAHPQFMISSRGRVARLFKVKLLTPDKNGQHRTKVFGVDISIPVKRFEPGELENVGSVKTVKKSKKPKYATKYQQSTKPVRERQYLPYVDPFTEKA